MRFFIVSDWKKIPFDVEMHLLGKEGVQFRLYFFADRRPPLNFSLSNYRLLPDPTAPILTTIYVGLLPSITATTAKKRRREKVGNLWHRDSLFLFGAKDATSWVGISKRGSPGR